MLSSPAYFDLAVTMVQKIASLQSVFFCIIGLHLRRYTIGCFQDPSKNQNAGNDFHKMALIQSSNKINISYTYVPCVLIHPKAPLNN